MVSRMSEEEFRAFAKRWRGEDSDRHSRDLLALADLLVRWRATVFQLLGDGGEVQSINATYLSTGRRKNAWGRYVNFYLAYTPSPLRQQGYATQLALAVRAECQRQHYSRLKSIAGSYLGVRLHMALGHEFWGVNAKGELIVDTPIAQREFFPALGTPIEARGSVEGEAHRMSGAEIRAVLGNEVFQKPELPGEIFERYEVVRDREESTRHVIAVPEE